MLACVGLRLVENTAPTGENYTNVLLTGCAPVQLIPATIRGRAPRVATHTNIDP